MPNPDPDPAPVTADDVEQALSEQSDWLMALPNVVGLGHDVDPLTGEPAVALYVSQPPADTARAQPLPEMIEIETPKGKLRLRLRRVHVGTIKPQT